MPELEAQGPEPFTAGSADASLLIPGNTSETATSLFFETPTNLVASSLSLHLTASMWERMIQLIQSGEMAMDTPHVPHNTPEGEVGKPEGLSGSQVEAFTFGRYFTTFVTYVNRKWR